MSDQFTSNFNSTFFLSLTTILISGLGVACAYFLKSKCSHVKLCFGLVEITRDVELEADIEESIGNTNQPTNITQPSVHQPQDIQPPINIPKLRRGSFRNQANMKEIIDQIVLSARSKESESISNKTPLDIEQKESKSSTI